ncbi:hypothetical protein WE348_20315 (plasmid) [Alteromonas macleodii]|uniref:hypothetical protein n=1 Tax=Alteromonas macleodii TaxID=28108 RepID=UPI0030D56221
MSENWLSFLARISSNKSDSILYFLLITIVGGSVGSLITMDLKINLLIGASLVAIATKVVGRYVAKKYPLNDN